MIPFRLRRETACMVMVDVQERLLPAISGAEEIRRNTVKLAAAAKVLSIPFVYTEQYPRGLGPTDGKSWRHCRMVSPPWKRTRFPAATRPPLKSSFRERDGLYR